MYLPTFGCQFNHIVKGEIQLYTNINDSRIHLPKLYQFGSTSLIRLFTKHHSVSFSFTLCVCVCSLCFFLVGASVILFVSLLLLHVALRLCVKFCYVLLSHSKHNGARKHNINTESECVRVR